MVNAIVLINAERTKINSVGEKLVNIAGITEVYSVSGRFDLVAIVRLAKSDELAELMTERITRVEGIIKTESMIAFKTLSRHDLESMFEIGE